MSTKKHTIYVINTADDGKSYWNRAGVAFENNDGTRLRWNSSTAPERVR